MKKIISLGLISLLLVSFERAGWCDGPGRSDSPKTVVLNYFESIKNHEFERAYDLITDNMKDDRSREEYSNDWRNIITTGQVIVHEFGIKSVSINGDTAVVEAWNRSSDIFNPVGIIENEIDRLIRINGAWKLDETEVLME